MIWFSLVEFLFFVFVPVGGGAEVAADAAVDFGFLAAFRHGAPQMIARIAAVAAMVRAVVQMVWGMSAIRALTQFSLPPMAAAVTDRVIACGKKNYNALPIRTA